MRIVKTDVAACPRNALRSLLILSMAALSVLTCAPTASADAGFGVTISHTPSSVSRSDYTYSYVVKVANTSATDPIAGASKLSLELSGGVVLKSAGGSGWICELNTSIGSCTSGASVAPGSEFPPLTFQAGVPANAADSVVAIAVASGGGAPEAAAQDVLTFGPAIPFGLSAFNTEAVDASGAEITQAGGHPLRATALLEIPRNSSNNTPEDVHETWVGLPAGFAGNSRSVPTECSIAALENGGAFGGPSCPASSAVGGVKLRFAVPSIDFDKQASAVYRLKAEKGYPAEFGFLQFKIPFVFRVELRSDSDYGITVLAPKTPQAAIVQQLSGAKFFFCGFGPRMIPGGEAPVAAGCLGRSESGAYSQPLLSMSTKCVGAPPRTEIALDSWQHRGAHLPNGRPDKSDPNWKLAHFDSPAITGCEQLTQEWVDGPHNPTFSLQPDEHRADSPAGYTAKLHIPQEGLIDGDGLATSHLRDVTVDLPQGVSLNPSVGDGIDVCTMAQMGALTKVGEVPPHFDAELPRCPDGSKIGNARIDTPLLENPLRGSIYLAAQNENPFASDYAIYLVVEEPDTGIVVKLAGKASPDPRTGRVRATFTENPEQPFEDLTLQFFGGGRAAIANPQTCGTFTTTTELTPWSAKDPYHPQPSEIATPSDPIQINQGPNGSPCVSSPSQRPFDIGLQAGSKDPIAGAKSPFSIRITRPDGNQEIEKLEISPPPGFVATLKGVPYCSEAQIQAAMRNGGKAEQRSPSCPKASEVGNLNAAAGAGPTPFYAPGKVYLAGPYKGQTLSVVAITPAVAGPFDLGNVVIRSALKLDPRTAHITAITDPIPQIVNGVPLRIRDIRIDLDRPGWAQNPTSCEAMSVDVTAFGSNGAIAKPSNRYQLGGCENLGFKPKLEIHLKGGTKRGDHPALFATLSTRPGDANIARAAVTLPPSAFLDQGHIRTICTRVQFAANACPAGAIYGFGRATTPLLDDPIEGNVYLRSSDNKLPDLVAALKGVANIEAVGRIDSVHGGIRNTFDVIPDAPFDAFTLKMQGGNKGLVVNSQDLCAKDHRATVKLTAQNGRHYNYRPKVVADNCKRGKRGTRHHRRHGSGGHS